MADKVLQVHPTLGVPIEVEATVVSAGAGDAGKVVGLDANGKLDVSVIPTGIGPEVTVIEAGEALDAGDFVNIYDDSGTAKIRKADASVPQRAHGFVLVDAEEEDLVPVYFSGINSGLSGLTAGTMYALSESVAGGVVELASASMTAGHIIQAVGVAVSATAISVHITPPVVRG